ncbi:hypothetical protein [Okeania sp. SIO3B5]|nr:hypothetical protein [Okeania sp. SIO3B5]
MRFIRGLNPDIRKLLEIMTPNSLLQYLKKVLNNLGKEYFNN